MKMPPKAKIYEAFSAIGDERVKIDNNTATVTSSDLKKEYHLKWNEKEISSDDNATFWQGYPGYPVLAVWLLKGILPLNLDTTVYFKNINWHQLNQENKRNYDLVVNNILNDLVSNGIDTELIEQKVDNIYEELEKIEIKIVKKVKD